MKVLALALTILCFLFPASAQSSSVMDAVVGESAIRAPEAAYLVYVASGKLTEEASTENAFALLQQEIPVPADRPLKASEYAFLLARSFPLPRGVLSTLFPGPRYSWRDLVSQGLFSTQADPDEPVTGVDALRILAAVMDALPPGGHS